MRNLYFIPQPSGERDPEHAGEFRAKALKAWIARLPTANHGMTTRMFHDQVMLLNRTQVAADDLYEALELLYPTFGVIEEFLFSRVLGRSFPLSPDEQKVGTLLEIISRDFLVGYAVILKEWAGASAGWKASRLLPRVMGRLIRGLSRILLVRFVLRIPEPEWIWLDLHSLYQLAERKGKSTVRVRENEEARPVTVECLYKQILLLQVLDPFSMTQREILNVYARFEELGQEVQFDEAAEAPGPNRRWVILDEDRSVVTNPDLESAENAGFRAISFDTGPLIAALQKLRDRTDGSIGRFDLVPADSDLSGGFSVAFIDYMIQRFGGGAEPAPNRFEDQKPRLLSIGLKATHQQLNPPTSPDEKIIGDWLVTVNEDGSLRCEFDQPGQLFLGSLISTRRVDLESGRRLLGVVSRIWMHRLDGAVHFQISVLSPQVMAAGIQPVRVKKDLQVYQRVLLFFESVAEGQQQPRLILESQKLRGGNMVQLITPNESVRVMLENRQNVGPGYSLFECVPLVEEKKEIIPPKGYDFL